MKYIFNAQFLKILPPNTSFGDAWESLCFDLLRANDPKGVYMRLGPPDRGIDILHRAKNRAYQCKADERGALGTIPAAASIGSLRTAVGYMNELGWTEYLLATNANYSGNGVVEILKSGNELGLTKEAIKFCGPEYWSELCEKHLQRVEDRLDYRLTVSEAEVIEAFRKARYYENKVQEYRKLIREGSYVIELANNRTPVKLQIPFSLDLTIKNCLDVAMEILGLSLNAENYPNLGTSARPSVSLTIDRIPQTFSKKLRDYTEQDLQRLELWITIIWKDELDVPEDPAERERRMDLVIANYRTIDNVILDPTERGRMTVSSFEQTLQQKMWSTVLRIGG